MVRRPGACDRNSWISAGATISFGPKPDKLAPFGRLDESAPGSGLGLSIVDELVRAYGGALTLGASDLGGLKVEMVLPRAE